MPRCRALCALLSIAVLTAGSALAVDRRVPQDHATIQEAVNACQSGDTVLIANGLYFGGGNYDVEIGDEPITVRSANGPDTCVIDCQGLGRAFIRDGAEVSTFTLEGLTIRNGYGGNAYPFYGKGGAVNVSTVNLTITDCVFENNRAAQYGGAIRAHSSHFSMARCRFSGNALDTGRGGALNTEYCHYMSVTDCVFEGNSAPGQGGAAHLLGSAGIVANSLFTWNTAQQGGGGALWIEGESFQDLRLVNCILTANTGAEGSAIFTADARPSIESCTVAYNILVGGSGGLYAQGSVRPTIIDSIVYSNGGAEVTGEGGLPVASYSDIGPGSGLYPGVGNINADPDFRSGPDGSLYLSQSGPCVNAGSAPASELCFETFEGSFCLSDRTTSSAGARDTGLADMGYHYESNVPTPTPTGTRTAAPTHTPTRTPTTTGTPAPTATQCIGMTYELALIDEGFETWPPPGWTIENISSDCDWTSNVEAGRPNYAGYDGDAACASNLPCGAQGVLHSRLVSPAVDLGAHDKVSVDFTLAFFQGDPEAPYGDYLSLEYDEVGGDWDDVVTYRESLSPTGPGTVIRQRVDFLGGSSTVRIGFRYYGDWLRSYAVLDDVRLVVCADGPSPTPTVTPTPTFTRTAGPTWTPNPETPTRTPTATPECAALGVTLSVATNLVHPGEEFWCRAELCLPDGPRENVPFVCLLDVGIGEYWFWPGWKHYPPEIDFEMNASLPAGRSERVILPAFSWPDTGGGGFAPIWCHAAMLTPDMSSLLGEMDTVEFGYGP